MNNKLIKILLPLVAIVVIIESIIFLMKSNTPVATPKVVVKSQPLTMMWDVSTKNMKMGVVSDLPLVVKSSKNLAIDAIDLYVKYDPSKVEIVEAKSGSNFVAPSFKKISKEKGMVVMNFLVTNPSGFNLKSGESLQLVNLKVNFNTPGMTELSLGDGTLVVENSTAKVLPFNSEKLVINVSQ